jgi:cation diffusion facilitator family transporter
LSASGLVRGSKIAQIAFVVMLGVGITELVVGYLARTVSLLADGIHSISTAIIFFIVFIGLRLSGRSPDGTFHFGYYRVEALGSLFAAFVLTGFGGFVLFESYNVWIEQRVIVHPEIAIAVASVAIAITGVVSWWSDKASKKYGSTSLGAGGLTGTIDVLSSVGVVISVILSRYFGIFHADSITGVLIAIAIFVSAYSIFKESSLVLVDACKCGDVVNAVEDIARNIKGVKEVHSIRMRKLGSHMTGDMHIVVENDMLVKEADDIATQVEEKIKDKFESVIDMKVRIESNEAHDRHSKAFEIKTEKSGVAEEVKK